MVSKTPCFEVPGVSLGGSGVSIGGVKILRVDGGFLNNVYFHPDLWGDDSI